MERGGINNEILINEVSKRRSLWDQKSLEYVNRSLKSKEWETVAQELNVPVDEVKNRWKLLKDSFNREVRNIARNNNTAKWAHFEQMSFLLKGSNSLLLPSAYLSQSLIELDNQSTTSSCDNENVYAVEEKYSPHSKRKKQKLNNFQSNIPSETFAYQSTPAVEWSDPGRHDHHGNEDYLFLMSLLPTFEKMSPRQKMLVKIKMMQDVYNAVFTDSVSELGGSKNDSVDSGLSLVSSGSGC